MQGITELNELMKNNANNDKGSLLEALERISRIARPETPGPVVDGGSDEEVVRFKERHTIRRVQQFGGTRRFKMILGYEIHKSAVQDSNFFQVLCNFELSILYPYIALTLMTLKFLYPPNYLPSRKLPEKELWQSLGSGQPGRSRTGRLGKAPRISSVNGTAGRHGGGFSGGHPAGGPGIGPTLGFGPGGFAVPGPSTGFGPGGFTGGFAVSGPLSGGPNRGFPIPGHSTSGPGGPRFAVPGQAFEGLQRGIGQVSGARGGQGSREQAAGGGGAPGNSSK
ncbi:Protein CBG26463 [Caenorhabditis briggsae]|uniref:Protein CBG26463 n=1 Tax=Caenorhabditis briggsae TaxID=6238 RepID=B6IFR0_CAEBR|nr:Protein CBG26463 [Caenorhabditis briggsae]CAR98740.1 Protein CBG26463 [Caenorhabditis briggsae]